MKVKVVKNKVAPPFRVCEFDMMYSGGISREGDLMDLAMADKIIEQPRALPDGPERQALMDKAKKLMIAYMPYKVHVHRTFTDLTQPWVKGYHRNIFVRDFYKYVDIDTGEQRRAGGGAPQ